MQVPGEMESARESQIRPCNSNPRQRARRESVRSFPKLLRCLADTQLNGRGAKPATQLFPCDGTVGKCC